MAASEVKDMWRVHECAATQLVSNAGTVPQVQKIRSYHSVQLGRMSMTVANSLGFITNQQGTHP